MSKGYLDLGEASGILPVSAHPGTCFREGNNLRFRRVNVKMAPAAQAPFSCAMLLGATPVTPVSGVTFLYISSFGRLNSLTIHLALRGKVLSLSLIEL